MSERNLTPAEAHRKLMAMERSRDEVRAPLPDFRVLKGDPEPPASPAPTPSRSELAAQLLAEVADRSPRTSSLTRATQIPRVIRSGADRLRHRRTVVLSTVELYRMTALMEDQETSSEWLRRAVVERIERLEAMIEEETQLQASTQLQAKRSPGDDQ